MKPFIIPKLCQDGSVVRVEVSPLSEDEVMDVVRPYMLEAHGVQDLYTEIQSLAAALQRQFVKKNGGV